MVDSNDERGPEASIAAIEPKRDRRYGMLSPDSGRRDPQRNITQELSTGRESPQSSETVSQAVMEQVVKYSPSA